MWFLRVVSDNTYLNANVTLYWASPSKSDLTLHVEKIHAVRDISRRQEQTILNPNQGNDQPQSPTTASVSNTFAHDNILVV